MLKIASILACYVAVTTVSFDAQAFPYSAVFVGSAVTVALMEAACPTAFLMATLRQGSWSRRQLWARHVWHVPTLTITIPATAVVCCEFLRDINRALLQLIAQDTRR